MTSHGSQSHKGWVLTLFGSLESANVQKVQIILRRVKAIHRRVEVSQARGETHRQEFLAINPMGKVPAVLLEDGDLLTESGALLFWFGRKTELWPSDHRVRAEVLRWMFFEQHSHEPVFSLMLRLRGAMPSPKRAAQLASLERKAKQALEVLESRLSRFPWVAGPQCSIADLALYPHTKWAEEAGLALAPYGMIRRWLSSVEGQPRFLPLGAEGAAEVLSFDEYFGAASGKSKPV